jgi:hypothetical protein
MKFAIINPTVQAIIPLDCRNLAMAEIEAGLKHSEVDHGQINRQLGIVVYEYGLFVPHEKQRYFAIGARLYAGNAVVYAFDETGETVDFDGDGLNPAWLSDGAAVERAISAGICNRPQMSVDGVFWRWPQPAPKGCGYPDV